MDKWKDSELEKMKAGGNKPCKEFLESQPDYREGMSLQEKYNTKAAALLRDKVILKNTFLSRSPLLCLGLPLGFCCFTK